MTEREGVGRRERDQECIEHEKRMDKVDADVNKQSGWLKASAGFTGVAMMIIGSFSSTIINKLNTIESLLTDSKISIAQHTEQIKGLDQRVRDIEDRHRKDIEDGYPVKK